MAMNRLGFSDREAQVLSFGEFHDLYREYQKMFDMENVLRRRGVTYQSLAEEEEHREKPVAW